MAANLTTTTPPPASSPPEQQELPLSRDQRLKLIEAMRLDAAKHHRGRRRRNRVEDQQLVLPSEASDVRELRTDLARINWRIAGAANQHQWRQLREVAMAVHICGRNDGCRAKVAALITCANRNSSPPLIRSESTWHRLWRKAVDIGIVNGEQQRGANGGAPSERAICHDRIRELVRLSPPAVAAPSDSHVTVTWQSPDSHHQRNKSSESSETNQTRTETTSTTAEAVEARIRAMLERAKIEPPRKLRAALEHALAAGCSGEQLVDRVAWFAANVLAWPPEHRPGALHNGLRDARPGERHDWGWPHRKAVR